MRLTDFHPKWFGLPQSWESAKDIKIGFTFYCPCIACRDRRGQVRLSVMVNPPIDPENKLADTTWITPSPSWKRTGDAFETITLDPSIDVSQHGHWHGFIINGGLINA